MRALGYFGFHAPVSAESLKTGLADPKDKLWEFNSILKAGDAFQRRQYDQAEALLNQVQQKDPLIYVIPFMLGESALRQQNWDAAVKYLQRSLTLNPYFDQAMTGIASALAQLGRSSEAERWIHKALAENPQNYRAWYELGRIKARMDPAAALDAWNKALEIQPNFAFLQRDYGMLQFRQKNYGQAADHLARAVQLGLNEADLYNFLGISLSQTGHPRQAVESYRKALQLDPNLAEAHLNLGLAHQRLNQPGEAAVEYKKACALSPDFCRTLKQTGTPHQN